MQNQNYRPDIDGLRALSICLVLAYHFLPGRFPSGFVGVDIFFVISGFLILPQIYNHGESFGPIYFYERRIRRVFPSLLLCLLVSCGLAWVTLLSFEFKQFGKHLVAGAGFVSNFVFSSERDYFHRTSINNPLLNLWSLSIEEQFYFFFPVLFILLRRKKSLLIAAIAVLSVISFCINIWLCQRGASSAFYLTSTRLWEFGVGGAISLFDIQALRNRRNTESWLSFGGTLLVIASLFSIDQNSLFPGFWALLPTLGSALIIIAGPNAFINRRLLSLEPLVWLGLISYPLYLWHWPLLSYAHLYFNGELSNWNSHVLSTFILVLSVFFSWLSYRFLERPLRYSCPGRTVPVVLLLCMISFGLFGYHSYRSDWNSLRPLATDSSKYETQFSWFGPDQTCLDLLNFDPQTLKNRNIFCSLNGDIAQVHIALIGDSSANSLYPGLKVQLERRGQSLIHIGTGGCVPFRGFQGMYYWNKDCEKINEKIFQFILSQHQIKTVIYGFLSSEINEAQLSLISESASESERFSIAEKMIGQDLTILKHNRKHVVVTFDIPFLPKDPRTCLRRRENYETCSVPPAELTKQSLQIQEWTKLFSRYKEVCIFNQTPTLLRNSKYYLLDTSGIPIFRDDHHLSYLGSSYVAADFLESSCLQNLF